MKRVVLIGAAALLGAASLFIAGCRSSADPSVKQRMFPNGTQAAKIGDAKPAAVKPNDGKKYEQPTDQEVAAAKKAGTRKAIIKTDKGDIEAELYGADTPLTVANFVKLANAKFYDGLKFHRVETNPGFELIQGGDPNGDGSGGPGYQIKREIAPKLKHVEGALAMARSSDPDSAGSQFYICNSAIQQLDGQYAVFGKVTKGLDVSKKIAVGDKIISVTIEGEKPADAAKPAAGQAAPKPAAKTKK